MQMTFTTGLVVLFAGILVAGFLVTVTARFARRREDLIEAMVQYAFLPEKRRWYMTWLSLEGSFFLLTALAWGLTSTGILPESIENLLLPVFFLGGMASIASLTWIGLRPSNLSIEDRARMRAAGPAFLYSLAMAPIGDGPPAPQR